MSEGSLFGTTRSRYDLAGRRTRLTWRHDPSTGSGEPFAVDYAYLVTGEMSSIKEASGFELARFGYDDRGRRILLARGNGTETHYGYDGASRLDAFDHRLAGTAGDLRVSFGYNPAGQIVSRTGDNDAYASTAVNAGDVASPVNGLNQLTNIGAAATTHDARGNLTFDGAKTFGYTAENRLASAPGNSLYYDALGRLFHVSGSATDLRYDGSEVIEENEAYTGAIRRRYVHGPGVDEPLVSYDPSGNRRWLHADERGSIIATSDQAGNAILIARYDEYGVPQGEIGDRFGYTGQMWLPEVGVYSYKARMYDPGLGRFLQSDPTGYEAGINLYAYVGGDPVNATDPSGLIEFTARCTGGGVWGDGAFEVTVQVQVCTYSGGVGGDPRGSRDEGTCHPMGRGACLSVNVRRRSKMLMVMVSRVVLELRNDDLSDAKLLTLQNG